LTKIRDNESLEIPEYASVDEIDFRKGYNLTIDHLQENSAVLLIHAILLYPRVIKDIITVDEYQKLAISLGGDKFSGWQKKSFKDILGSPLLNSKHELLYTHLGLQNNSDIEGLDKIMDIYVERSKILWKNNQIALWVKACVGMILNMFDKDVKYETFIEEAYATKTMYTLPFQVSRYKGLVKHNFSDHVDRLDLNNIQDNMGPQQIPQEQLPQLDTNQGFLSLLLGSLLPWNRVPDNANAGGNPEEYQDFPENQ